VDNPVRSPFTKSKDRDVSEDRKSIKRNEPNRTEQNRILYGGEREKLQQRSGENCGAG
jgi:hypothetical protein